MESHNVFKQAVDGHVSAIAQRLGLHQNSIYKMMVDPVFCRYTRWLPLFIAIYEENPIGGEHIYEDFRAVVLRLRAERRGNSEEQNDWRQAVARAARESTEAITAEIESGDPAEVEKEIVEAIAALRELLPMVRTRGAKPEAGGEVVDLDLRRKV